MSLSGIKTVFMGTPVFALPTLKALVEANADIVAVVTQPDRPKGRGRTISPPPVKEFALEKGLRLFQPQKVREREFIKVLENIAPDLIVVVAFGQILPADLLNIPKIGCVNVHASLLPAYRGAAPINWAIVNGEVETGITTMLMDEGLDTGDMLLVEKVAIGPEDDSELLYGRLAETGGPLLVRTLEGLKDGTVMAVRQDDAAATYAPIIKKEDGIIDWSAEAAQIVNLVRGMRPWPTAQTRLDARGFKVLKSRAAGGSGAPGEVLKVGKDFFEVAAGSGSVEIYELQLEGKKAMKTADFLMGYKLKGGEMLGT
ncbi:MAG: methionyl-tRNA formyltransferase [Proteobacteria bacterium]|nr:methionyl-tRNA formyltransferase [Pseudomonadota bacterium]